MWKSYSYWLALPIVAARVLGAPVPVPTPDRVLYRLSGRKPFIQFAFASAASADGIAMLPGVAPGKELRSTFLDRHLDPLMDRLVKSTRVTRRVLRGELAYGVARIHQQVSVLTPRPAVSLTGLLEDLGLDSLVIVNARTERESLVVRRTCCLALVVPGLGHRVCPDCVVPPTRGREHARAQRFKEA